MNSKTGILALMSAIIADKEYGSMFAMPKSKRRYIEPSKRLPVEKPQQEILNPPKGCKVESVEIRLYKEGYACEIYGYISYANQKSRFKHLKKWSEIAKNWFGRTHIREIISEPFVSYYHSTPETKIDEHGKHIRK